jgi:hypothetical protein
MNIVKSASKLTNAFITLYKVQEEEAGMVLTYPIIIFTNDGIIFTTL